MSEGKQLYKWPEVLEFDRHSPITASLYQSLTLSDCLLLCQTCKYLYEKRATILSHFTDLNTRLLNYFNDPVKFRRCQGDSNALLSGPFVLHALECYSGTTSMLDIYVRRGFDADELTAFLENSEKYEICSVTFKGRPQIVYRREGRDNSNIRVHITSQLPIYDILTNTGTSAHINIISWNKLYSVFPRQTLLSHRFYPLKLPDDSFGLELRELEDQGWSARDIIWPDFKDKDADLADGIRRVGDNKSLILRLNIDGIQVPDIPDSAIEYCQFEVSCVLRKNIRQRFLNIHATILSSPSLFYEYTYACEAWHGFLKTRLTRWSWLQYFKVDSELRSRDHLVGGILTSNIPSVRMSEDWDYADDQIHIWFRDWEVAGKPYSN